MPKSRCIRIVFALLTCAASGWSAPTPAWSIGKFAHDESGTNVTGTHSHVASDCLVLASDSGILFSTDNGDVVGSKRVLGLTIHDGTVELSYRGCLHLDDELEERPCPPQFKPGTMLLRLVRHGTDLRTVGKSKALPEFGPGTVFHRVDAFDFE